MSYAALFRHPSRAILCLFILVCTAKTYSQQPDQFPSITPSFIHHFNTGKASTCFDDMVIDTTGRMWLIPCKNSRVLNSAALQYFDGYQLHHYELNDDQKIVTGNIRLEGITKDGYLYGTIDNKIFLSDFDHDTCSFYDLPPSANGFNLMARITESPGGNLLILLQSTQIDSLQLWSLQKRNYSLLIEVFNPIPARYRYGLPLQTTSHDIWFMGERGPIHRLRMNNNDVQLTGKYGFDSLASPYSPNEHQVNLPKVVSVRNGDLFLYQPNGHNHYFLYFNKKLETWSEFQINLPADWQPENIFQDQKSNLCFLYRNESGGYMAILRDTSGQLWNYSSVVQGKGQIKGMTGPDFFQKTYLIADQGIYSIEMDLVEGINTILTGNWIASMTELPGGKILINTIDDRWKQYDPNSGRTSDYKEPDYSSSDFPAFSRGMKEQIIISQEGFIWFLNGKYLIRYDPDSSYIQRFDLDKKFGLFILLDNDLVALVRENHYLEFFNIDSRKFEKPLHGFSGKLEGRIRDLCYTDHRYLWVPTNRGLYKMDFQDNAIEVLGLDNAFGDVRFTTVWDDPKGKLWLGTYYNGVVIYDKVTEEKRFVNTSHGLCGNGVMGMIGDASGDVWVSTENGISVLSPIGEVLGEVHKKDGLSVDVFERFDPFLNSAGKLFFGSSKGVNIIDPVKIKENFRHPGSVKMYLTSISYFNSDENRSISKTSGFSQLNQLEIPSGRRNLEIQFALSENINPAQNHFAYKLGEQDKVWTFIGSQNSLDFDYLPAGDYKLILRGSNHKHQWSNTISIPLRVNDYFYNQSWFYLIILGFLSLMAFIRIKYLQFQRQHLKTEVEYRTRQIRRDKETIERQARDLKKLNELKTSFFSNISHEIRTPVTLIKTPVDFILSTYSGRMKDKVHQSLITVRNNADRLLSLINDYLELSRLELGEQKVVPSEVDIEVLIQKLVRSFQMAARTKGVQLDYIHTGQIRSMIHVDRERLIIILNNLLNNAVKYTDQGCQIKVTAGVKPTGDVDGVGKDDEKPFILTIKVSDNGQGIPTESIPKIFDRFYRVPGHSNHVSGSGIGLALVKELTELMDGGIYVKSQLGYGSDFTVTIPTKLLLTPTEMAKEFPAPISVNLAQCERNTNRNPVSNKLCKILLVEDDPEVQDLIQSVLDDTYRVIATTQGKEAMEWLKKNDENGISLIISDYRMPVMDGLSLLKEIKRCEKLKNLPFLMLTAKTGQDSKIQALRLGVDDYLLKPFSPEELKIRARNLTENFQNRMQLDKDKKSFKGIKFSKKENANEIWLSKAEQTVKKALKNNQDCSVGYLAKQMNLSERQMNRRIKSMTGMAVGQYIREVKLYKARNLLEDKALSTVAEVAYACGFNTPKYFSRSFSERFGKRPGDYLK